MLFYLTVPALQAYGLAVGIHRLPPEQEEAARKAEQCRLATVAALKAELR